MSEKTSADISPHPAPRPGDLEEAAVDVVTQGARVIRAASGHLGVTGTKSSPTDTVTALDLEVERVMRKALAQRTPGASIIGEEHDTFTGETQVGWVIDPIDGTVNLTYDLPVIGVSLAATIDGEVVAGAVFDVVRGEVFSAAAGTGARRDGSLIRPSAVASLANALVATGFAYTADGRESEADYVRRVLPAARDIRCFGSTALHLCWVACGRIDASYQRNVQLWDYAAGALIASEAGASVQLPAPHNGDLILAAGPSVFDPLLRLVG